MEDTVIFQHENGDRGKDFEAATIIITDEIWSIS